MDKDNLRGILTRLAALRAKAQAKYEEAQREEFGDDWESESDLWFTLEYSERKRLWRCGYRVRADEATVWALVEDGSTPEGAAHAMWEELRR